MAVVLIGSTGNGKSTLGNFLIDPAVKHRVENPTFSTANDNKPHTKEVLAKQTQWIGKALTIIDTPGLNETPEKDLAHVIDVVEALKDVGNIQACLFVVKFGNKIDAQYRATVEYYSKLLPTLFERNTAIVMTDFATDDRSVALRKEQGVDENTIQLNATKEISASGRLRYTPCIFTIDCVPVDTSEEKTNEEVRQALLNYICGLTPAAQSSTTIVKPAHLKQQDEKEIERLNGEIGGYSQRLIQAKKTAEEALTTVEGNERNIIKKETDIESQERKLQEKDKYDLITTKTWSVDEKFKLLRPITKDFDLTSEYRIAKVNKWSSREVQWKHFDQSEFRVKGTVTGKFSRRLTVTVELQTTKKDYYKDEIATLRSSIQALTREVNTLKRERDEYKSKYHEHLVEVTELEKFIDERRKRILKLAEDSMMMDEAIRRRDAQN